MGSIVITDDMLPPVAHTDQGAAPFCLIAGTPVLMENMQERPIETVAAGNMVFTHDGRRRRVVETYKRPYDGKLYTIKIQGHPYPLTVTPEHPIFAARNVGKKTNEPGETDWIKAGELSPGDYVLLPANRSGDENGERTIDVADYVDGDLMIDGEACRTAESAQGMTINRRVVVNETFARLLGLYVAEGHVQRSDGEPCGLVFTFARHERPYQEFVVAALSECVGTPARIVDPKKQSVAQVTAGGKTLALLFAGLVGSGALKKFVPSVIHASSRAVKLAFLRGWLEGDGTQKKVFTREGGSGRTSVMCTGCTSSERLHRGIIRLAMDCGLRPSASIRQVVAHQNEPGRPIVFYSQDIITLFPETAPEIEASGVEFSDKLKRRRDHRLGFLAQIKSIEISEAEESTFVYNFAVEDVQSYVANGVAVHNCFANAPAEAIAVCDVLNGIPPDKVELASRLELVYFAHAIEGDVNAFDGAFLSDVFHAIEKLGFAPEHLWPYDDSPTGNFRVRPPENLLRMSYDQISLDYGRILTSGDKRLHDLDVALSNGRPVVFGTQVSNAFASNELGPDYTYDIPPEGDIDGGHALLAVRKGPDGRYRVRNSWGNGWGDRGWCWMTPEVMAWSMTSELWAVAFKRKAAA
jgi:hypothetical protein